MEDDSSISLHESGILEESDKMTGVESERALVLRDADKSPKKEEMRVVHTKIFDSHLPSQEINSQYHRVLLIHLV
jgi:hypothetical protein